jgi:hypothetical protein
VDSGVARLCRVRLAAATASRLSQLWAHSARWMSSGACEWCPRRRARYSCWHTKACCATFVDDRGGGAGAPRGASSSRLVPLAHLGHEDCRSCATKVPCPARGRCPTSAHSPSLGVHKLTRRLAAPVLVVVLQRKRRARCAGRLLPPHQSTTQPTCNLRSLQLHVFCECPVSLPVIVDLGLVVPLVPGLFRDLASALTLAPRLRQRAPCWCCHHILCRVVFPLICHPPQGFLPLGGVGWREAVELGCVPRCHRQLQGRSSCPVKLWSALLFTILSPLFGERPSEGGCHRINAATRGGARVQWQLFIDEYVV